MTKIDLYREQLRALTDWREFLMANSNLPGPRGNIELAMAFGEECSRELALGYARLGADAAPENTPACFLAFCGVIALGRAAVEGEASALTLLRERASDPRWRVREAVAMALQRLGDADMEALLTTVEEWSGGVELEQRAAAAAICEPRLLRQREYSGRVLAVLSRITESIVNSKERRSESFRILRQAMGYCWSVAVAAYPVEGKAAFERWPSTTDRDLRRVLRENLKKKRLVQVDPAWTARALKQFN